VKPAALATALGLGALSLAPAVQAAPARMAPAPLAETTFGEEPKPGALDPRIRTVEYDPDQVVQLKGWFGYQLMVEFALDERIENVSIGDALGWQVTPNKRANLLFLKPIDRAAVTNMTVVTDKRRYAFDLTVAGEKVRPAAMAYIVRFRFPQDAPVQVVDLPPPAPVDTPIAPENWNLSYTYAGARDILPSKVFDDGKSTFFAWPATAPIPAIFAVAADGSESLINYAVKGRYLVVDQLAQRFRLRSGKSVTTVTNAGWAPAQPGADAPVATTAAGAHKGFLFFGKKAGG
jgi:type IV secretion system protein VirB9